jgi:hypothetical protein
LDHGGYRRQNNLLAKLPDDERILYLQRLDIIMDTFSGYTVPVVTLKDTPRDIIAEIFERINRYGKRLTTVDLIQAATWRVDFDLSKSINTIRKSIGKQGFVKLEPINILRNISAATGRRFFAGSIMSLGKEETKVLDNAVKVTKQGYELAVDFLVNDL